MALLSPAFCLTFLPGVSLGSLAGFVMSFGLMSSTRTCVLPSAATPDILCEMMVLRMLAARRFFLAYRLAALARRREPGLWFLPSGFCRRSIARCARRAVFSAPAIRRATLSGTVTIWSGVAMLPMLRSSPMTTGSPVCGSGSGTPYRRWSCAICGRRSGTAGPSWDGSPAPGTACSARCRPSCICGWSSRR